MFFNRKEWKTILENTLKMELWGQMIECAEEYDKYTTPVTL